MDAPGFESQFLRASRVAVWGLGLMGGSLAMALNEKCAGLVGLDTNAATVTLAQERRIVEDAIWVGETRARMKDFLRPVDLLILATPVRAILQVLEELPALVEHPLVVLDLGSTKEQIVAAMNRLPDHFDPVGGHPMCGKEQASLHYAEAGLFRGATFAFVKMGRTSIRTLGMAEEIALAAGACPLWIDAVQHDRWVAATSHAPFLAATALANSLPEEAAVMAGPGFRSAARLSASSPEMMVDILATNTENIRDAISRVRDALDLYERLLAEGDFAALSEIFEEAGRRYMAVKWRKSCA